MIPPLAQVPAPATLHVMLLAELRARGFEGSLSPTYADRTVLSTDNSIYQVFRRRSPFPGHRRPCAHRAAAARAALRRAQARAHAAAAPAPTASR